MTVDEDFDIPGTGAIFTFGKSRFAENAPSKFWIKNDIICKVACGDEHTAIVTGSGRVFTIGNNSNGQLGLGHRKSVPRPSCVKALKPQRAVQIACGRAHTLAATDIGCVFAWGHNGDGQLGSGNLDDKDSPCEIMKMPTAPVQLAAGSAHSMLLTDKGEVYVWGSNREGQLGHEEIYLLTPTKLPLGNKIASITCGYYHSLAITDDCKLLAWGEVEHGKLSLPDHLITYQRFPQPVSVDEKVVMAAAGSGHTLVLTESGNILSCGMGSSGQLGQGGSVLEQHSLKPVIEVKDNRFVYISASDNHSAAISEEGLLFTWGSGRHGKLCLGEQNFTSHFTPALVNRMRHLTAVQVECGGCHTMVLGYRRLEMVRNIPKNDALIGETKDRIERPANHLRTLISKPMAFKGAVLPTIPSEEPKEEAKEESNYPPSHLQENYWSIADENLNDPELALKAEEGRKKASRFAHFWSKLLKRENNATVSYESKAEEDLKQNESGEPAKLEDLENTGEKSCLKGIEYEEEEEENETTKSEEQKRDPTEQRRHRLSVENIPQSRTCALF